MSATIGTQLGSLEITALLGKGGMGDYEKLLDRTRRPLDVETLKTIFGRKNRPHHRTKRGSIARLKK